MTKETITLVAALIAAAASLATLVLKLIAEQEAEARAAHRRILGDAISDLGETLHELMACSKIMVKTKSEETFSKWETKAKDAQRRLNTIRVRLKYALWGLEAPLRTMTRVGSWTTHYRHDGKAADKFLQLADILRQKIDLAVKSSYCSGNPPSLWRRWRASVASDRVLDYYKNTAPSEDDEALDDIEGDVKGSK